MQPEELALSPARAFANTEWFEALFRYHYPGVVGFLTHLTGDPGQAEEIAADTFSKLARRSGAVSGREEVAAWLYRVATNAGLDALRADARRRRKEEAAGTERLRVAAQPGALEEMMRQERAARVRAVLATLKPRDAQILLLRHEGMAYREIARTLGVQSSSVGTLLARAEREFERRYRARHGDNL